MTINTIIVSKYYIVTVTELVIITIQQYQSLNKLISMTSISSTISVSDIYSLNTSKSNTQ